MSSLQPSSNETPGMSLPPSLPSTEQTANVPGSASGGREAAPQAQEQRPSAPEMAPRTGLTQPAAALPAVPPSTIPSGAQNPAHSDAVSTTSTGTIPVLNDNDKIEKEWVNKVKQIVERTRNDPHRQSEELTVVKADYMQQRYNKTIKVDK